MVEAIARLDSGKSVEGSGNIGVGIELGYELKLGYDLKFGLELGLSPD